MLSQVFSLVGYTNPETTAIELLPNPQAVYGSELKSHDVVKCEGAFYRVYESGHEERLRFWNVTAKVNELVGVGS